MSAPTYVLTVSTRVFAPPARVWAQRTDPALLRAEFPPALFFALPGAEADRLRAAFAAAAPVRVTGRFTPFRLPWPIELRAVTPGESFLDTSENALYRAFSHLHRFEAASDGCRTVDQVTFTPAFAPGLLAAATARVFVHRHRTLARHLPVDPRATAVAILRRAAAPAPDDEAPATGEP
jgi:ligand-binding SRPBCC domain-containing protein